MKTKEMKIIIEVAINENREQNARFVFDVEDPKNHSQAMWTITQIVKQGYIAKVYGEIKE